MLEIKKCIRYSISDYNKLTNFGFWSDFETKFNPKPKSLNYTETEILAETDTEIKSIRSLVVSDYRCSGWDRVQSYRHRIFTNFGRLNKLISKG